MILAPEGRPARVKFTNCLASGTGEIFSFPWIRLTWVRENANGPAITQNEATLHLHGGVTPWISELRQRHTSGPRLLVKTRRAKVWPMYRICGSTPAGP